MAQIFRQPLSPEQLKARQDKIKALAEEQRKTEYDLIIAELLTKIAELEADKNDND